jgi:hypothetical protein
MSSQPTLALDRVLRVLQPLVRLLVRNGVTYTVLAAALKRLFLDAAQQELAQRGMATTDSAVSLLSGVHRRDVRELTRAAPQASAPSAPLGLAAQVVARWMNQPEFGNAQGQTRVLPKSGGAGSFDALVAGVSRDVRPRAVLDELLRLGVVQDTEAGLVLEGSGFAPRQGFEEMSWLFAANLQDHAKAAVANLQGDANFLEQAVFVDQISADSARQLHTVSVAAWQQAFKLVMQQAQTRFDTDAPLPAAERGHRARFGVYRNGRRSPAATARGQAKNSARFRITPTTAAVMADSGAVKPSLPCVASTSGPPARMKTKLGRKVKKVTTAGRQRRARNSASGPSTCLVQPPTKPTKATTMISGPGVVSPSARPSIICVAAEPLVLLHRPLVDIGQHRIGAAEGQQRRLGEEPAHLRERALPALRGQQHRHARPPTGRAPMPPAPAADRRG